MKRMILMFVVVALAGFLTSCVKATVNPPERLANVPEDARWVGGSDGGNWFQLVRALGDNTFHFKIYNDQTGEVEADSPFILNAACNAIRLDSATVIGNIDAYDGNVIILKITAGDENCVLSPK